MKAVEFGSELEASILVNTDQTALSFVYHKILLKKGYFEFILRMQAIIEQFTRHRESKELNLCSHVCSVYFLALLMSQTPDQGLEKSSLKRLSAIVCKFFS